MKIILFDIRDKIEDLEQQIYLAYSDGDYQRVSVLEKKLRKIRGPSTPRDHSSYEPYSLEGHVFIDDDEI